MQIIQSTTRVRPIARGDVISGLFVGGVLFVGAIVLGFLIFGTPFLDQFTPSPRPAAGEILAGVLAWSFALTAPAGFGLIGAVRLATVLDRATAKPRTTPAVRSAAALGDECTVAARVYLPDGRFVPEIVIGPFGAAVIEELPPADSARHTGDTWEVQTGDGRWMRIENPLDRATRDADRVRRWLADDDQDFVVKVHAAVVTTDRSIARTPTCAVITEDRLPAWLAALPAQRSLNADRRERILERLRPRV